MFVVPLAALKQLLYTHNHWLNIQINKYVCIFNQWHNTHWYQIFTLLGGTHRTCTIKLSKHNLYPLKNYPTENSTPFSSIINPN